jgi:hypothetical protein
MRRTSSPDGRQPLWTFSSPEEEEAYYEALRKIAEAPLDHAAIRTAHEHSLDPEDAYGAWLESLEPGEDPDEVAAATIAVARAAMGDPSDEDKSEWACARKAARACKAAYFLQGHARRRPGARARPRAPRARRRARTGTSSSTADPPDAESDHGELADVPASGRRWQQVTGATA